MNLFFLAWVCGLLASCADDLPATSVTDADGQPLELTVSQATISATRLELGQDGLTTMWQPRDQLVLVKKDRTAAPIYLNCTLTEPASSATFASESGVPAGDYWVIYNYNEYLAYGHHGFSSVDEINERNKLVLYGELNLAAGTSTATVEMQHLYAQVMVELKNVPAAADGMAGGSSYIVGMYSSKKGMPVYKQFTVNGLVNAEYGINPNDLNNYNNSTYFPSEKRWHNIRFGYYNVNGTWVEGYHDSNTGEWVEGHFQPSGGQLSNSALILPEDLSQEEVFFYVIMSGMERSKCYEVKKAIGKVNLQAGVRYKVVLDLNEADINTTVSTLNGSMGANAYMCYEISTPEQWRHATYRNENYGNYKITADIDFTEEYFFPLRARNIDGNGKTLTNIELDWSDEDNVGLYKAEWELSAESDGMRALQPKQSYCNISNLTLESVTFEGKSYVGALGGYNVQADNCKVIGSSVISGSDDYVGGIVGWNRLSSNNMEFWALLSEVSVGQNCAITGTNYVGGIGGDFALACYNGGSVDRIVLRQSFSDGKVKGDNYVGGILGNSMASVNTCYSLSALTVEANGVAGGVLGASGMGATVVNSYFAGTNPTNCGIIGNSAGYCTVDHCLTTLSSLGTNLDTSPTGHPNSYGPGNGYCPDTITDSEYSVTFILDKKAVINGDNAYSDNYWSLDKYPWYCVKFDSFSADTNAPDYKDDVIN